jgi:ArsR family transcriptional regulator, arsenate/arsenite/antimonite-responsive transcriptional repressor
MMKAACKTVPTVRRDFKVEAKIFAALADEHRLRIVSTLARAGEVCVCDLNAGLPLLQPTVSHHLKLLKAAGLVESERRGTWVYYRLAEKSRDRLQRTLDLLIR